MERGPEVLPRQCGSVRQARGAEQGRRDPRAVRGGLSQAVRRASAPALHAGAEHHSSNKPQDGSIEVHTELEAAVRTQTGSVYVFLGGDIRGGANQRRGEELERKDAGTHCGSRLLRVPRLAHGGHVRSARRLQGHKPAYAHAPERPPGPARPDG